MIRPFLLSERQMARISPCFPLSHGVPSSMLVFHPLRHLAPPGLGEARLAARAGPIG
ncbi:MAG: hypothetical protein WBE80_06295 [Methylocella sp.]